MGGFDLEEIAGAMEAPRDMGDYFVEVTTGEVVLIPLEVQEAVEAEAAAEEPVWPLPEWAEDLLPIAKAIYDRGDPRWARVPQVGPREIYEQMVAFAQTVEDGHLKELLEVALDGRGAFRRFKDVLARYPHQQERWYRTKAAYLEKEARAWLEELNKNA